MRQLGSAVFRIRTGNFNFLDPDLGRQELPLFFVKNFLLGFLPEELEATLGKRYITLFNQKSLFLFD
jgi:hypothetical protein